MTAAASNAAHKVVTSLLTSPSKVVHALDWRKSSGALLSLRVGRDRIDLAVASHPFFDEPTLPLPSVPVETRTLNNIKVLKESVGQQLKAIAENFNVCGVVVSWPVQKEGWCGAPCGRTLHALDQVSEIFDNSPPICLYDPQHHIPDDDAWGRSKIYSQPAKETMYVAPEEDDSHSSDSTNMAVQVLNDFYREYWPEFYHQTNANHTYGRHRQYASSSLRSEAGKGL
jgi:hypothetical protein